MLSIHSDRLGSDMRRRAPLETRRLSASAGQLEELFYFESGDSPGDENFLALDDITDELILG